MEEDIKNEVNRLLSKLEEIEKILNNTTNIFNNLKYSIDNLESKLQEIKYEVRNIGK